MYSKRHRLNACSTARDTYTRKENSIGNGGGGGIFSKVDWLVRKWIGTLKRLFQRENEKSASPCGMFEMQEPFPRAYFTHTITYAYWPLLMGD